MSEQGKKKITKDNKNGNYEIFAKDSNALESTKINIVVDKEKKKKRASKTELDTYFFQIASGNIIRYFNYGMLLPVKYIGQENRTTEDIQTRYEDYLVLTKKTCIDKRDNQLFIEIVLSTDEIKNLVKTKTKNVFLHKKPVPVSRITSIRYDNIKDIKNIQKTIEIGRDSYMVSTTKKIGDIKEVSSSDIGNLNDDKNADKYSDEINKFDKIMGMFAFMKNTPLYYGHCANYSDNYFKALSLINSNIGEQSQKLNKDEDVQTFKRILKVVEEENVLLYHIISTAYDEEKNFDLEKFKELVIAFQDEFIKEELKEEKKVIDTARKFMLSESTEDYIKSDYSDEIFKLCFKIMTKRMKDKSDDLTKLYNDETKTIQKLLKRDFAIDSLKKQERFELLKNNLKLVHYYYALYMAEYGDKNTNDKENIKNNISYELPEQYAEITLALMGLYFGYFSLPPQESIINIDPAYEKIIENPVHIKFKLDSLLDFLTIESIYQFVFHENRNYDMEFIIEPDTEIDTPFPDLSQFENNKDYEFQTYDCVDKKYYSIKKKILV